MASSCGIDDERSIQQESRGCTRNGSQGRAAGRRNKSRSSNEAQKLSCICQNIASRTTGLGAFMKVAIRHSARTRTDRDDSSGTGQTRKSGKLSQQRPHVRESQAEPTAIYTYQYGDKIQFGLLGFRDNEAGYSSHCASNSRSISVLRHTHTLDFFVDGTRDQVNLATCERYWVRLEVPSHGS